MIGVILLNMGGPDKLSSVRPFLYNLFSDRKIIRLGPSFLQRPIAWFIARKRAPKSAACYEKIGGKSPLLEITRCQAKALERMLNESVSEKAFLCEPGMRYFSPRTPDVLRDMVKRGIKRFIALSMYPHYSLATSGTSIDDFKKALKGLSIKDYQVIDSYPDHPLYVKALCECIKKGMEEIEDKDNFQLVYSAHSLPKKMVDEGDPYVEHVKRTISAIKRETGLNGRLCFQSRSGPVEWLSPSTDELLLDLCKSGVGEILCVPISFVSDHIETLYEIDMLYGDLVKRNGARLIRTPSLNESRTFIKALCELVLEKQKEF